MTLEQGKPLNQARQEVVHLPDMLIWHAEEGRRVYGRTIPARDLGHRQVSAREPMGPIAAFTTWNYPAVIPMKKVCAILAAGCTCVLKGAEETPASTMELVRAFADAGLPDGVLNLVYGAPDRISSQLIASPAIRGISFTGSTPRGPSAASWRSCRAGTSSARSWNWAATPPSSSWTTSATWRAWCARRSCASSATRRRAA